MHRGYNIVVVGTDGDVAYGLKRFWPQPLKPQQLAMGFMSEFVTLHSTLNLQPFQIDLVAVS